MLATYETALATITFSRALGIIPRSLSEALPVIVCVLPDPERATGTEQTI